MTLPSIPCLFSILLCTAAVAATATTDSNGGNFTVVDGQIYTPGLAIIDAPQPNTPLGGDTLQVAIEVSGDGQLPWPPPAPSTSASNTPTLLQNITIFLTSYDFHRNFTISNGTDAGSNDTSSLTSAGFVGPVLDLEPSSTVKHVNWIWPACLVGNGPSSSATTPRGSYNISIHQSFRCNGTEYYTVFNLPIRVTNSISAAADRVDCVRLENQVVDPAVMMNSSSPLGVSPLLAPGSGGVSSSGTGSVSGVPGAGAGRVVRPYRIAVLLLLAVGIGILL